MLHFLPFEQLGPAGQRDQLSSLNFGLRCPLPLTYNLKPFELNLRPFRIHHKLFQQSNPLHYLCLPLPFGLFFVLNNVVLGFLFSVCKC